MKAIETRMEAVRWCLDLAGVLGRRITYRQLCAIDDCGFMWKE